MVVGIKIWVIGKRTLAHSVADARKRQAIDSFNYATTSQWALHVARVSFTTFNAHTHTKKKKRVEGGGGGRSLTRCGCHGKTLKEETTNTKRSWQLAHDMHPHLESSTVYVFKKCKIIRKCLRK